LTRDRLRLLFLLPFPPRLGGTHGGARVTGQLIGGLAARHDVAALFHAEHGESAIEPELAAACDTFESVERRGPPSGLWERILPRLSLLRGVPIWASEIAEPRFATRTAELAAEWRPDVVQLEYPVIGQYLPALAGCAAPRVLVDHDAGARGIRRWPGLLGGLTGALDARAWGTFERRVLTQVDAGVVFTERDRQAVERLGTGTPIRQIPLGTPVPETPLDPLGGSPPGVLFVGNFAHPPNVDAARWLAAELFPAVRRSCAEAHLTIVGPGPPPDLAAIGPENAAVTGEVPDVLSYLDAAAVVVAPLRTGGGMRVKVVEALAAGKAVVATPLAVEGLGVTSGDQLEIAEGADELVAAMVRLLTDSERRTALAARARQWASEHLGWETSLAGYEALYHSLLARRGPENA
jgi:glycosyltransferase involved in cell wall biosynthesis